MTAATVIGKYQLVRKLATGGMAEVFLAKVAGPGGFEKPVVLKRILPHLAEDEAFVSMFLSEARLAAQLNHPNIVSIFDFGQEQGQYVMVMEFIDGLNLRQLCRRAHDLAQPMDFALAAKVVSFACEGLAYAHDFLDPTTGEPMNLVHRDISPDNILLARNGVVKVVDFGIAKAANQTHHTKTGTIKGKFAYMPPEQLRGQPLDRRADVFALGIVLYELVTGQKPFEANTDAQILQAILYEPMKPARELRADVPDALQAILDRALEKQREARYPDCRALQADLERFVVSLGEPVGQFQLAQLAQRLGPSAAPGPLAATPPPRPSGSGLATPAPSSPALEAALAGASPSLAATTPVGLQAHRDAPAPSPLDVGFPLEGRPAPASGPPPQRRGFPAWAAVLGLGVLMLGGGVAVLLRPTPAAEPAVRTGLEADAGTTTALPSVVPTPADPVAAPANVGPAAAPADVAPTAAPGTVDPAVDAGVPALAQAPSTPSAPPRPTGKRPRPKPVAERPAPRPAPDPGAAVEPGKGTVEFRVRPYASVYVDGRPYGDTPFGELLLPVGRVQVKLVNKELGKDVTVPFDVKPGKNTFRYNFEE